VRVGSNVGDAIGTMEVTPVGVGDGVVIEVFELAQDVSNRMQKSVEVKMALKRLINI